MKDIAGGSGINSLEIKFGPENGVYTDLSCVEYGVQVWI